MGFKAGHKVTRRKIMRAWQQDQDQIEFLKRHAEGWHRTAAVILAHLGGKVTVSDAVANGITPSRRVQIRRNEELPGVDIVLGVEGE